MMFAHAAANHVAEQRVAEQAQADAPAVTETQFIIGVAVLLIITALVTTGLYLMSRRRTA
ncbi:MAG: hypothetical protein JWM37_28 [Candidatus Saccharibacteria bacterium]|nr:hypothetical protein [Candidatus Saccharibacteria bacterium]